MNCLLFPICLDSRIQFPPKSLNYAALLSVSLDNKELTSFQIFQLLQRIFIYYTRLESLSLSYAYIKYSSLGDIKPFFVSRLRLADIRFESLKCLGQLLCQLSRPKKGLHSLWLKNVTIESDIEPLQETYETISLAHLSCDSSIPKPFKLLHTKPQWLEFSVNSCLLQSFYASPLQISSHKYPLFYTQEVTNNLSPIPTIHILLKDTDNLKQLYMVPKHIIYMYLCLLLISRSLDGGKLVNISHKQAREFFFKIVKRFKDDKIDLDEVNTKRNIKNSPNIYNEMIYSPALTLSILCFNLIVSKLLKYLEQSDTSSIESHQVTIELDTLKENDIIILLPNFINLLKFLRLTPSTEDDNNMDSMIYTRRYSKKKVHQIKSSFIKLTFILPCTSRAIVLSYTKKRSGVVLVIETPLVLCLPYNKLKKSRFFIKFFDDLNDSHDYLKLHKHFTQLYTSVCCVHSNTTISSSNSQYSNSNHRLEMLIDAGTGQGNNGNSEDREVYNKTTDADDIDCTDDIISNVDRKSVG